MTSQRGRGDGDGESGAEDADADAVNPARTHFIRSRDLSVKRTSSSKTSNISDLGRNA